MSNNIIDEFRWFTSGGLETQHNIIEICNTKYKHEYENYNQFH